MKSAYLVTGLLCLCSLVAFAWAADFSRAQWASFPWMPVFYLSLPVIGIAVRRIWNGLSG